MRWGDSVRAACVRAAFRSGVHGRCRARLKAALGLSPWLLACVAVAVLQIGLLREAAALPVFSGTLDQNTSPSMSNRLNRNGVASTCSANKVFPGTLSGGPFFFATATYTHRAAATCVTFTMTGSCGVNALFSVYSGAFSPGSLSTNYLADPGLSGVVESFGVQMAPGQTVTVVVNSISTPGGCTFEVHTDEGAPPDSLNARAIQNAITPIVAQTSGAAISSAVDNAIHDAFAPGGGQALSMGPSGMRINFAAEPERSSRIDEATSATSHAPITKAPITKAPPAGMPPKAWSAWVDVHGTGWKVQDTDNATSATGVPMGSINGSQVNATAGVGRLLTPDLLVGVLGGTEFARYDVSMLGGGLKARGETVGGYAARRFGNLRIDGAAGYTWLNFDINAASPFGSSSGSLSAHRWLATGALTGTYRYDVFMLEPSARIFVLREHENAWIDSLATLQPTRDFTTGRASVGSKVMRTYEIASGARLVPFVGLYSDYVFLSDDAVPIGGPVTTIHDGFAARATGGVRYLTASGASVTADGEVGGLGANYLVWVGSLSARVPF
jgi:hypothetical protein